jgi:hypothetical protein
MGKSVKSFSQFASYANRRKPVEPEKEFEMPEKDKDLEPLANDVEVLKDEFQDKKPKPSKDEWEIVSVIGVSKDEPELTNELSEAVIVNADLGQGVKRGELIYITAMLKKKESNWTQPNVMGVVKVRVVDIYNSLSILNGLK